MIPFPLFCALRTKGITLKRLATAGYRSQAFSGLGLGGTELTTYTTARSSREVRRRVPLFDGYFASVAFFLVGEPSPPERNGREGHWGTSHIVAKNTASASAAASVSLAFRASGPGVLKLLASQSPGAMSPLG